MAVHIENFVDVKVMLKVDGVEHTFTPSVQEKGDDFYFGEREPFKNLTIDLKDSPLLDPCPYGAFPTIDELLAEPIESPIESSMLQHPALYLCDMCRGLVFTHAIDVASLVVCSEVCADAAHVRRSLRQEADVRALREACG